ncbi:MAG: hypothetical protein AAB923_00130 [Patescibacteria group bacterium]
MAGRGFSQNLIIALVGILAIAGAFLFTSLQKSPTPDDGIQATAGVPGGSVATSTPPSTGETILTPKPAAPKPSQPSMPSSSGGASNPSGTVTIPVVPANQPTAPPLPASTEPPAPPPPPPPAWSPGFQAAVRTYPYIPSENERATLPSCDSKSFSAIPVDMAGIASIAAGSSYGTGTPAEYEAFTMKLKDIYNLYDFTFPADVWVTTVVQEQGISSDPEDSTVYFALCKDVVGYVTHVKELSAQVYKFVTDSVCLGKPHTGPSACKIEILTLVSKGSVIGKVGRTEGAFGFGVIDLRTGRGLANPSQYGHPVRMEFAACPFKYFTDPSGFAGKRAAGDPLCPSN